MREFRLLERLDPILIAHSSFEEAIRTSDSRRELAKSTFRLIQGKRVIEIGWSDSHFAFLMSNGITLRVFDQAGKVAWSLRKTGSQDAERLGDKEISLTYKGAPHVWDRQAIADQMIGFPVILFGFGTFVVLAVRPGDDLGFFLFNGENADGSRQHFLECAFT